MKDETAFEVLRTLEQRRVADREKLEEAKELNRPEVLKRNQERSHDLYVNYTRLYSVLAGADYPEIVLSDYTELKELGRGRVVCFMDYNGSFVSRIRFDRGANPEPSSERYEFIGDELFWEEDFSPNIGGQPLREKQLLYLKFTLPDAEETFDWILGKVCDFCS
jgi:hypothetical protein